MNCQVCNHEKLEFEIAYDRLTLQATCRNCREEDRDYIPSHEIVEVLDPETKKMINKAISTRLDLPKLIYFLKFASVYDTQNINQTFRMMIEKLQEVDPLHEHEIEANPFSRELIAPIRHNQPEPEPQDDDESEEIII